jgi:ubiquinone/menaquinone biosynthesis C-methylase UbiE
MKGGSAMSDKTNLYAKSACYYDYDVRDIVKVDLPFYLEYAAKYPGEILELACGTGRVAITLAQNGYRISGIDLSASMLGQFGLKLQREPHEVRERIQFGKGDMTDFELERKFSLIIVPFRVFQCLTNTTQQKNCLQCVRRHLADQGAFIINVFQPYKKMDQSWIYPESVQWETVDVATGNRIIKKHRGVQIDIEKQIIYPEMIYQVVKADGGIVETRELLELKYYYYDQLKELLETEGFEIIEEFGYYDKSSIRQGKEMIFVCRKADHS